MPVTSPTTPLWTICGSVRECGKARFRTSKPYVLYVALFFATPTIPPLLPPIFRPQLTHPRALLKKVGPAGGNCSSRMATLRRALKARSMMRELAYLEKVDPSAA